jgi:uncharacterized protein
MASGYDLTIPCLELAGGGDGPHLAVVALQHGNEVSAFDIVRRVYDLLPDEIARGRVTLIPVANPIAFEASSRATWIDALSGDGGNMNRLWPGAAANWLTEKMVHALWSEALESADIIVDLHNGTPEGLRISYGYVSESTEIELSELDAFRLVFGCPILLRGPDIPDSLTTFAAEEGKLSFAYEVGEFAGFTEEDKGAAASAAGTGSIGTAIGARGVMNLLKASEICNGNPDLPSRQVIVSPETKVSPESGGLLYSHVSGRDIGRVMDQGDLLGEVVDPFSMEVVERLEAPHEESLLIAAAETTPCARVNPGDYAYYVADWSTASWIENSRQD